MIAIGKNSPAYGDSKKFYKSLQDVRRKNIKEMVNSPFLELDGVCDVLKESPERLAVSLQYFLQGIGTFWPAKYFSPILKSNKISISFCRIAVGNTNEEYFTQYELVDIKLRTVHVDWKRRTTDRLLTIRI